VNVVHLRVHASPLKQGHIILAFDGLQPEVGHEVLWVCYLYASGFHGEARRSEDGPFGNAE
jgi:hypothetical protein